jgi:hypothetical protein
MLLRTNHSDRPGSRQHLLAAKRPALLAAACLIFASCADWIGEPLQDAAYRTRGDQITREDAKALVFADLFALGQRCPEFNQSGVNWWLNYAVMMDGGCVESGVGSNSDFFTGCADLDFLGRQSVADCRIAISADSCSGGINRTFPPDRMAAFAICADAFESGVAFPFLFF